MATVERQMALIEFLAEYGNHAFVLPDIAGKYAGRKLAVCGDAACVWEDLEALGCRNNHARGKVYHPDYDFMTVNKLVEVFPGNIEHAYSNAGHLLDAFIAVRRQEYSKEFAQPRHTHSCQSGAKHRWPFGGHGTSSLGATLVGLGLGYDEIVLCGIPLDNSGHNGEPHWRKCRFADSEAAGPVRGDQVGMNQHWKRAKQFAFEGKVKSMSGRTRDWLGAPV